MGRWHSHHDVMPSGYDGYQHESLVLVVQFHSAQPSYETPDRVLANSIQQLSAHTPDCVLFDSTLGVSSPNQTVFLANEVDILADYSLTHYYDNEQ